MHAATFQDSMNAPMKANSLPQSVVSMPPILDIRNLTVSFDGFKAVDDLSMSINEKELRVIIGPNGAGKTTLLDMICGKTKPTSGSIRFRDLELTRLPDFQIVRKGVGRKFQNPSIYEDLTVGENLEISIPQAHGVWASILFGRTRQVKERIGSIAGRLSHGQKQWLEIGMLLVQDPDLLLLDEPVAGMSPREREQTAELLKTIALGKSLVVIEHDMDFVKAIANTITVLHQGKLLSQGSVDQVQNDPRVIEVYLGH
jgi:urea transport system ATP-binding protein